MAKMFQRGIENGRVIAKSDKRKMEMDETMIFVKNKV